MKIYCFSHLHFSFLHHSEVNNTNYEKNIPIDNGFYIDLPSGVKMVPSSINLSGTEFWLKKSNEIPTNLKVVHWDYDDDRIVFLFAGGVLETGANLFCPGANICAFAPECLR